MKKRLNIENPFFAWMGKLADMAIANLLFIICSLPVITMGASIVAVYQTFREMKEEDFVSVFRSFMNTWKGSIKRTLPAWSFQFLTGFLLFFDIVFLKKVENTWYWHVTGMILGGLLLLWSMMSVYLLPTKVYESCTLIKAIMKSLYLSVRNLPYTIVMIVLNSIPIVCFLLGEFFIGLVTPVYMVLGFSITVWFNMVLLERCKEIERNQ